MSYKLEDLLCNTNGLFNSRHEGACHCSSHMWLSFPQTCAKSLNPYIRIHTVQKFLPRTLGFQWSTVIPDKVTGCHANEMFWRIYQYVDGQPKVWQRTLSWLMAGSNPSKKLFGGEGGRTNISFNGKIRNLPTSFPCASKIKAQRAQWCGWTDICI